MLQEARRVLKKGAEINPEIKLTYKNIKPELTGGAAAFSVWGLPELSQQFTFPHEAFEAIGLSENTQVINPFHLYDI
jgi:hypothetical protein